MSDHAAWRPDSEAFFEISEGCRLRLRVLAARLRAAKGVDRIMDEVRGYVALLGYARRVAVAYCGERDVRGVGIFGAFCPACGRACDVDEMGRIAPHVGRLDDAHCIGCGETPLEYDVPPALLGVTCILPELHFRTRGRR